VFAIQNNKLQASFKTYQDALASKWRSNPCLFKKDNWKAGADKDKKAHQQWVISKPEMLEAVQPWSMSSSTTTTATDGLEKWFSTTALVHMVNIVRMVSIMLWLMEAAH